MNLISYKETFDFRHDFDSEDLDTLRERWPSITFHNIPDAWILLIDEMLCAMRYSLRIAEIRQEFGQLIVLPNGKLSNSHQQLLAAFEAAIYKIDADISRELGA